MEIIKLVLPVVTFALGCIFTWELKTADIENQSLKTSVGEVCRLCKEWYTQIENLALQTKTGKSRTNLDPGVLDYVNNRLILPDLLRNVDVARRYSKAKDFVEEADRFLQELTTYDPNNRDAKVNCEELLTSGGVAGRASEYSQKRDKLDSCLQRLNKKAADLL
jgi:DNA repair ATPase RecN